MQPAIEQPENSNGLTTADRMKMMELLSNTPEHAIKYVADMAKPFMSESEIPKPEPKPVDQPIYHLSDECSAKSLARKRASSSAGHMIPFNVKKLRNHLVRNNISQGELARKAGVSSGVMSAMITSRSKPGLANRGKVCQALGKPIDWLNS